MCACVVWTVVSIHDTVYEMADMLRCGVARISLWADLYCYGGDDWSVVIVNGSGMDVGPRAHATPQPGLRTWELNPYSLSTPSCIPYWVNKFFQLFWPDPSRPLQSSLDPSRGLRRPAGGLTEAYMEA